MKRDYSVEPVEGLWLLGLDANFYAPVKENVLSENGVDYKGSSGAGIKHFCSTIPSLLHG